LGACPLDVVLAPSLRVFHPERVWLEPGVQVGGETYLIGNTQRRVGIQLGRGVQIGAEGYLAATGGWIDIGAGAVLGRGVIAYGNGGLTIGAGARLEDEVAISTINHRSARTDVPIRAQGLELAPVVIGPGAVIGRGAIVLPGVQIGPRARIAPGSVVTRDVAPDAWVGGVPARVAA
jgi:acetyltransferase-like isoleucine patch superfamily enzyme